METKLQSYNPHGDNYISAAVAMSLPPDVRSTIISVAPGTEIETGNADFPAPPIPVPAPFDTVVEPEGFAISLDERLSRIEHRLATVEAMSQDNGGLALTSDDRDTLAHSRKVLNKYFSGPNDRAD